MSNMSANKIGIQVYVDPATYTEMESMRNPKMSRSAFYSTVLEEAFGIRRA